MNNAQHIAVNACVETELVCDSRNLRRRQQQTESEDIVVDENYQPKHKQQILHECREAYRYHLFAPAGK